MAGHQVNYYLKQWFQILILPKLPVCFCKMAAKVPALRLWFKRPGTGHEDLYLKKPIQVLVQRNKDPPSILQEHWEPFEPVKNLHQNYQAAECLCSPGSRFPG